MTKALAAAALAAAVLLGACGKDEDPKPPSEPPAKLLARAAAQPVHSGVATIQVNLNREGSGPFAGASSVSLHGPYALDPGGLPRFDFDLDAQVAGFGVDGSLVSTGDDAFVVFFGENYRVGPELVGRARSELGTGPGVDIASWVRDPAYGDVEDVSGVDAVRIDGTLDSPAAARDLTRVASALGLPADALAPARAAAPGPVSVWVALEDETIRRVSTDVPLRDGEASLDAQISSAGEPADIRPPEGGGFQPIERLIERVQDLSGLAL